MIQKNTSLLLLFFSLYATIPSSWAALQPKTLKAIAPCHFVQSNKGHIVKLMYNLSPKALAHFPQIISEAKQQGSFALYMQKIVPSYAEFADSLVIEQLFHRNGIIALQNEFQENKLQESDRDMGVAVLGDIGYYTYAFCSPKNILGLSELEAKHALFFKHDTNKSALQARQDMLVSGFARLVLANKCPCPADIIHLINNFASVELWFFDDYLNHCTRFSTNKSNKHGLVPFKTLLSLSKSQHIDAIKLIGNYIVVTIEDQLHDLQGTSYTIVRIEKIRLIPLAYLQLYMEKPTSTAIRQKIICYTSSLADGINAHSPMSIAFWAGVKGDQFGFLFIKNDDTLVYSYYTSSQAIVEELLFHFPKLPFLQKSAQLKVMHDKAFILYKKRRHSYYQALVVYDLVHQKPIQVPNFQEENGIILYTNLRPCGNMIQVRGFMGVTDLTENKTKDVPIAFFDIKNHDTQRKSLLLIKSNNMLCKMKHGDLSLYQLDSTGQAFAVVFENRLFLYQNLNEFLHEHQSITIILPFPRCHIINMVKLKEDKCSKEYLFLLKGTYVWLLQYINPAAYKFFSLGKHLPPNLYANSLSDHLFFTVGIGGVLHC